jgi:hypothetical protein
MREVDVDRWMERSSAAVAVDAFHEDLVDDPDEFEVKRGRFSALAVGGRFSGRRAGPARRRHRSCRSAERGGPVAEETIP